VEDCFSPSARPSAAFAGTLNRGSPVRGSPTHDPYDNTKLVARILGDGTRMKTRAFTELQSHYLLALGYVLGVRSRERYHWFLWRLFNWNTRRLTSLKTLAGNFRPPVHYPANPSQMTPPLTGVPHRDSRQSALGVRFVFGSLLRTEGLLPPAMSGRC
jgi:hypothetical protein